MSRTTYCRLLYENRRRYELANKRRLRVGGNRPVPCGFRLYEIPHRKVCERQCRLDRRLLVRCSRDCCLEDCDLLAWKRFGACRRQKYLWMFGVLALGEIQV